MMLRRSLLRTRRCGRWRARASTSASASSSVTSPVQAGDASTADVDALLSRRVQESVAAASQDMLPALKVLSESLGLVRESPAFQNWSSTDWLMGLTVLAHHNTMMQRKRRVKTVRFEREGKKLATEGLVPRLLRYVRISDSVYASSTAQFCKEANVDESMIIRSHPGGVFSPKYVLLLDHSKREIVLAVRGSASILDFCTDLCLINEEFMDGQGHRGMVHAANWLVRHVKDDLKQLAVDYPAYQVVTTGHSLGAGVVALATMRLKEAFPGIHCYAFAAPASVTHELAEGCYDYVTSVVNGDDCVPRLHQHSMLKLQEEISRFDWRSTLKQLVAEEVEEQKLELRKQKEIRLSQIQGAFRKIEEMNRKQLDEAAAKLNSVKQVATQNILELSNDVDKMLADTVDVAFASFKTDKLTLDHINFMKKLLTLDKSASKDRVWWARLDDSVLLLERLSDAVKQPEELERVVKELKGLLQKSISSTPFANNEGANSGESRSNSASKQAMELIAADDENRETEDEATQLQLLRNRIDNVVRRTSSTLKEKITEQVSKVSGTVVSNVSEYVDNVKTEAEAFGARVLDELDLVQEQVTLRASSVFSVAEKTLGIDITGGTDDSNEVTTVANGSQQTEPTKKRKLMHAPLFPPGRILYLNRVLVDAASGEHVIDDRASSEEGSAPTPVELMEVGNDEFSRVVLSHQMILDHLCTTYERMLLEAAGSGSAQEEAQ